jgi:hypothetical protein
LVGPPAPTSPVPLDALKLPSGSVIVVCEQAKEALQLLSKFVVLSPEMYQEMRDRINRLEREARPSRPILPSECHLSGGVVGGSVRLRLEYRFKTDQPRAVVFLGCRDASPVSAVLDPQSGGEKGLALLDPPGEEGYTLRVVTPGEHQFVLEVVPPPVNREGKSADQGFEINLPGAAITTFDHFEVAEGVTDLRLTKRLSRPRFLPPTVTVSAKSLREKSSEHQVVLGPAEHLEVAWKSPAPRPAGPPLLAAEGVIRVRVEDTHITTDVVLNLKALQGETDVWRLHVPPTAVVSEPRLPDERIKELELPREGTSELTVQLREPGKELKVAFQVKRPRQGDGKPVAIGPFALLASNQIPQKGTITVTAPADLRVRTHLRSEGGQRDVTEEQRPDHTVAAYTYWNWPPPGGPVQPLPPLCNLDIEPVKGLVETHLTHKLRLEGNTWKLSTELQVLHCRTGIDRLDVQVPASLRLDPRVVTSSREVLDLEETAPGVQSLKLSEKQFQRFSVLLTGQYQPLAANQERSFLDLPRVLETVDRGTQVEALLPDDLEFVPDGPEPGPETTGERNRRKWVWERSPGPVELAWRPYRPELAATATADVTLTGRQARVRLQVRYRFPHKPPDKVLLSLPAEPAELIDLARVENPGNLMPLTPHPAKPGTAWAGPLTGTAGKKDTLILSYTYRLPERGHRVVLPLVWPADATRVETKVRIWCDAGFQVGLLSKGWEEQPIEFVEEKESLPALVLRANRTELPLSLSLTTPPGAPLASVVADRSYLQTTVGSDGYQTYQARFWLSKLGVRELDVDLPASPALMRLEVFLGGKRLPWQPVPGASTRARLPIEPELYHLPVLLELRYGMSPNQTDGAGLFVQTLAPPIFSEDFLVGPVRWSITLPSGWVPLHPGKGYVTDQRWGLRGWLPAPRPALSASALEDWFQGGQAVSARPEDEATLVCLGTSLKPLNLLFVPQQQLWMLGCSLVVLLAGLALAVMPLSRSLFWLLVVLLLVVVVPVGVLWPSIFRALVFGSQPGVVVLLVVLVCQWMLHRRYRRQVVFLPGFNRRKTGSSLVRARVNARVREPSTVDEPPKVGSAHPAQARSDS